MTDPQPQRPTSQSPTEASRPPRPENPASRPNNRPPRVGVYERLGRSTGLSPAIAWSLAMGILDIVIALIIVFVR